MEVSRPEKVLFPATSQTAAVTKQGLADHYAVVAELMLPHLAGRPISMERCPDGIEGPTFYEKKRPSHFPAEVPSVEVAVRGGPRGGQKGGHQQQVVVDSLATLTYLVGQACVTPHTWTCRGDRLDRPDLVIWDLDPSVEDLAMVRRATRLIGEVLDEVGLTSFVKTTGSRGYHVVVPLRRTGSFEDVRGFAVALAEVAVAREPDLVTLAFRKTDRGDRVLIDCARNGYAQTTVPPYAVRTRPGAPVSVPIGWSEVGRVAPDQHTVASLGRRLARVKDPWADLWATRQSLGQARDRLPRLTTRPPPGR